MRMNRFFPIMLIALLVMLTFMPETADAWKPYLHNFSGETIKDNPGTMTINEIEAPVNSKVAEAIANYPQFYFAGTVGPDGFPDLAYGQMAIHGYHTGEWLKVLINKAWEAQADTSPYGPEEKLQILAFTYGYLSHCAGDMWAHTLINDLAGSEWPGYVESLRDVNKLAVIIKHLTLEGYIADATPGFDGNPDNLVKNTPGYNYDVPVKFIYDALIKEDAQTPYTVAGDGAVAARGPLIGGFMVIRKELKDFIPEGQDTVAEAELMWEKTVDAYNSCAHCSGCRDCLSDCADLGWTVTVDNFTEIAEMALKKIEEAALYVFYAYGRAWIKDINDGLPEWGNFGLETSKALFDAETRRDFQRDASEYCADRDRGACLNEECLKASAIDVLMYKCEPFFYNKREPHLLSMIGLPDVSGDVLRILNDLSELLAGVMAEMKFLDPINATLCKLKTHIKDEIKDAVEEITGADVEEWMKFTEQPTQIVCKEEQVLHLLKGEIMVPLFKGNDPLSIWPDTNEHEVLDKLLGLPENHHMSDPDAGCGALVEDIEYDTNSFAPLKNTVTMMQLLLLDAAELDTFLGKILKRDIGTFKKYSSDNASDHFNIMTTNTSATSPGKGLCWLNSIDSDHAWRVDGQPRFDKPDGDVRFDGITHRSLDAPDQNNYALAILGGRGEFPLWSSCVLRGAFKKLFKDWENDTNEEKDTNFPALGDYPVADPVNDPEPPESKLALNSGCAYYNNGTNQFIGGDNKFTLTAHDIPEQQCFQDAELKLQYRRYTDSGNPGEFKDVAQGFSDSISGNDGIYFIDNRASDPCHTFFDENESGPGDPLPPEPTQTTKLILDTTPPVLTCIKPPFGNIFDTDDVSAANFNLDDGPLGSGVAGYSATIDGYLTVNGTKSLLIGSSLDMYFYYPGTRTVTSTSGDNIGNTATNVCTFEIHATVKSLMNNVKRATSEGLIKDPGTADALLSQLKAAENARIRKQIKTEIETLKAFIALLTAQRGQWVDLVTADRFIAYANDLIVRGG